jgi:adenosylhomocysteine nucleosidase
MSKTRSGRWMRVATALLSLALYGAPAGAVPDDLVARTAILSANQPEWLALRDSVEAPEERVRNGTVFVTGLMAGKPVVLFLSGTGMVNAAMTTQLALDHFNVERLVLSGIAGGVDPSLNIGDVVVPVAWRQYLEAVFARETGDGFALPAFADRTSPNFGIMFPQPVTIARSNAQAEKVFWFHTDPGLLQIARGLSADESLVQCTPARLCLPQRPRLLVGGNGVSGPAFVDNRGFRDYVRAAFEAGVVDMESAAVAHVALANGKPFIAFRSVAHLAGGGEGESEAGTFFQLASDNSAAMVRAFIKAMP